ncbi:MAG TPA: SMC family ATPase, partial [Ktedonobacteraceae bacterium]|nr:SMC family ATPase [Ktedonobacteraceae bacterium]
MFILKHLTVERFRLLREVNLHFPQRGSILIQGPNEAGKSTLFESIYFALYGEPLASLREGRSFDDLILYGATTASVTLTFSVGAQELTIARTLERGQGQQVALQIRSLGLPDEEPITDIETANQRIISTLNDLDGKTLRNSSFIEQKGLTRLEVLSGTEREASLRKLLGLEDLTRVASGFTLADEDEQLLARAIERFKLAEIQSRLPELSAALNEAETSLDALTIVEDLDEMQQQEVDIADQVRLTEQLQRKRHILKSRQQRLQQLKKADLVLSEIIDAYDAIAEAQREIPDLERQIADLERHEREELPALEKRVQDLGDLIRSFGTLERMASDLLDSVNSIKDLEKGVREYDEFRSMLEALDEQVSSERHNIDQMTQAQHEIEDNHKRQQPRIANRLAHLKTISARLKALHRLEDQYGQGIMHQGLAEENSSQIKKVLKDIKETEQDLAQTEKDSKDVLKQSEELDERWRQVCIRRQLEDWQRLKGLSQNLAVAEQKVRSAHEQQGQLGLRVEEARKKMMINGIFTVALAVIAIVLLVGAIALFSSGNSLIGFVLIMLALILIGGAAWAAQQTRLANKRKKEVDQEYNNGQNQVSTMVAAREAAVRMGGSHETLARAENEIRALGGTVPNTVDEGQRVMESLPEPASDQSVAELQEQMNDLRTRTAETRNQINAKKETVVALRKEWGRLDEQRRKEGWNEIEARLRNNKNALTKAQDEIRSLASSEGLPVPSFDTSNSGILASSSEFETLIEAAIKDAERELVTLSSRLEAIAELQAQSKVHEDALDTLLVRKQAAIERQEDYELHNPHKKIAEERERQAALREALRHLQDSLRERVKPLGVSFGQAAISSAEAAARKQLESMHIMLGRRVGLESRHSIYGATLRERQGSL